MEIFFEKPRKPNQTLALNGRRVYIIETSVLVPYFSSDAQSLIHASLQTVISAHFIILSWKIRCFYLEHNLNHRQESVYENECPISFSRRRGAYSTRSPLPSVSKNLFFASYCLIQLNSTLVSSCVRDMTTRRRGSICRQSDSARRAFALHASLKISIAKKRGVDQVRCAPCRPSSFVRIP